MAVGDETLRDFSATKVRDPLLGTTIDDYLVQAVVGTGAMGIVYRGMHQVIGKPVAIKVLKPDYAADPEMVARLIREARTVNAIRHPAIVDIFGFGTLEVSGQPYIVMDLLEGEPLDAYIKREAPLPARVAFPILDELLGALGAAHQVGVIHRDLKPGNVFLESHPDQRSRLKVIDFGLARQADRAGGSVRPTNPGTLLGTPAFMAPEQVLGTKVTPATDLYAVGGIAYQLLTGHLPHEAPSAIEVISQKMQHDPIHPRQWNPRITEEVDAWIMSLLRREPDDRPSSVEEVRSQLRRVVDVRTQGAAAVQPRRVTGPQATLKMKSGASPVHRPGLSRVEGPTESPKDKSLGTAGVVPKREWSEAKTLLVDGVQAPLAPAERTTDRQLSPFAQTAIYGMPAVTPPMPAMTPPAPAMTPPAPAMTPPMTGPRDETLLLNDGDLPTLPPGGELRLRLQALERDHALTDPVGPTPDLPGPEASTADDLRLPKPARWPWFVVGGVALVLLGVLAWLAIDLFA